MLSMAFAEVSITFMFVCECLWCSLVVISAGDVTCLWASFCRATLVWVTTGYTHILVGQFVWFNLGVGYLWVSLCGATLVWATTGYTHTCG